jgi:hypothetical protein
MWINFIDLKGFALKSAPDINIRVLLALAYRSHFGDSAFDKINTECSHLEIGPDGRKICTRHV